MKPTASFKTSPEDFVVEEIPAYLPSGVGEHLYLFVEKRGVATDELTRTLAKHLGLRGMDVGAGGMKDRNALTRQWISLPVPPKRPTFESEVAALAIPGVRVLEAKRHGNKLRTGHLRGNRFHIVLRDVDANHSAAITEAFEVIRTCGVPNAYGAQRFGRDGDNADACLAFLRGDAPAPRDFQKRRFLFSALQSKIFNRVLEKRRADGTWNVPQLGDLLSRERPVLQENDGRGGAMFLCEDPETDRARALTGEVSPTGPMPGAEMRKPGAAIDAFETSTIDEVCKFPVDWERAKSLGEGTRRPLRVWVEELSLAVEPQSAQHASIALAFVLPKGAYATTVLDEVFELIEPSRKVQHETSSQERP
jgi:tRNA pseudouridine13 synthase